MYYMKSENEVGTAEKEDEWIEYRKSKIDDDCCMSDNSYKKLENKHCTALNPI